MMNHSEMQKFYNQYRDDQQNGFVSSIEIYVENKLKGLTPEEIKEVSEEINKIERA